MSKLDQVKLQQVASKIQVTIFDEAGKILESCDTLLKTNKNESIFDQFIFLQSLQEVFKTMPLGDRHEFPEVEWEEQRQGLFSLTFDKLQSGQIQLVILDKTSDYPKILINQQSRNDSAINEEVALLKNKVAAMENQLLGFQNEELKRIQTFKNQFFANVSHELRTPLNSISGLVSLIQDDNLTLNRYLPSLKATSNHLNAIINDILDLSKIEAGKLKFEKTNFNLQECISNIIAGFEFEAESKNTQLKLEAPKETILLKSDPTRLSQVLYNLMGNALKFTSNGVVTLAVKVLGEENGNVNLRFELTDTGIGMTEEQIRTVLEPYAQADHSTNRIFGGTGLGLNIAIKLIEAFGGKLTIASQPQQGTTMRFDLAFAQGTAIIKKNEVSKLIPSFADFNILFGEDDPVNQAVIVSFLKSRHAKLTVVSSGEALLSSLANHNFDLVISDIQFPGISGIEVISQTRSNHDFVPFLFVSGNDLNETTSLALLSNWRLLQKPIDLSFLEKNITDTLALKTKYSIDLSTLQRTVQHDQSFINEMVETILASLPLELNVLNNKISEANWSEVRKVLHKIRPSVDYLGIPILSQSRKEIYELMDTDPLEESTKSLIREFNTGMAFALVNLKKTTRN
ncbi:ATP-binding protein [Roseivirga echinicomitans]